MDWSVTICPSHVAINVLSASLNKTRLLILLLHVYVCMFACMYASIYVCMFDCMYVYMFACIYVCILYI